jgi:hypothetical protein
LAISFPERKKNKVCIKGQLISKANFLVLI